MRSPLPASPDSVLILDDEPSVRTILCHVMEDLGVRVYQAADAAEARRLVAERTFSCALIDKNLPGENGLAFLQWLRTAQPDCNAIMLTAYGNMDSAVQALRAGAFDYILKPFDLVALQHRVTLALEQRRMRTERAQLQTLLVQADRLASLGTLAAGVVHEVNTPLTYVMANVEYLRDRLPAMREPLAARGEVRGAELAALLQQLTMMEDTLREVHEGSERMRLIVRDVKAFARGSGEDVHLVDLHQVLEAALKLASVHLRHQARVVRDYGRVPLVRASGPKLAQVFLNLLINAGHALQDSPGEPTLTVRLRTSEAGEAVAEVADTGRGIAPEHLPYLFEPYFTTKPAGEGTGLGLFICRSLVESFGGRIGVESQPGQGSTFRVTLPPCEAGAAVEAPQSATRNSRTGFEPSPAMT
jgi:signal transduction histidine kinase